MIYRLYRLQSGARRAVDARDLSADELGHWDYHGWH